VQSSGVIEIKPDDTVKAGYKKAAAAFNTAFNTETSVGQGRNGVTKRTTRKNKRAKLFQCENCFRASKLM
jgi:hypothetical protein